jgi:hypothetical protein
MGQNERVSSGVVCSTWSAARKQCAKPSPSPIWRSSGGGWGDVRAGKNAVVNAPEAGLESDLLARKALFVASESAIVEAEMIALGVFMNPREIPTVGPVEMPRLVVGQIDSEHGRRVVDHQAIASTRAGRGHWAGVGNESTVDDQCHRGGDVYKRHIATATKPGRLDAGL